MQVQKHTFMRVPDRDNIINSAQGEKLFSLISLSVRRGLLGYPVLSFDAEFNLCTSWEGGGSTGLATISLPICLRAGTAAPWEKNTGLLWKQESRLEIARRQARSPPQASPLERRVETGKTCPSECGGMKRSFREMVTRVSDHIELRDTTGKWFWIAFRMVCLKKKTLLVCFDLLFSYIHIKSELLQIMQLFLMLQHSEAVLCPIQCSFGADL